LMFSPNLPRSARYLRGRVFHLETYPGLTPR
jgi:hypothetical protein